MNVNTSLDYKTKICTSDVTKWNIIKPVYSRWAKEPLFLSCENPHGVNQCCWNSGPVHVCWANSCYWPGFQFSFYSILFASKCLISHPLRFSPGDRVSDLPPPSFPYTRAYILSNTRLNLPLFPPAFSSPIISCSALSVPQREEGVESVAVFLFCLPGLLRFRQRML